MEAPTVFEIDTDGKIAALDQVIIPQMEGTVTMERTSEILFDTHSKRFVIYLIKPAYYVYYWLELRLAEFCAANPDYCPGYETPDYDVVNFCLMGFKTYKEAVAFEHFIIPFLRNHRGYDL